MRAIMRTQMEMAILWRKRWAGRAGQMPVLAAARQEDRNDIVGADREFCEEIRRFEAWREERRNPHSRCEDAVVGTCMRIEERRVPGLDNGRFDEWEDLNDFWDRDDVPEAVASLLETLVHDSRAWFKLSGWEASEVEEGLKRWVREYDDYLAQVENARRWNDPQPTLRFNRKQLAWIQEYKATGRIPEMETRGREPFVLGAGYLRFRRIYAGGDKLRLTHLVPALQLQAA